MPLPRAFLEHLRQQGYHSRSNKHSNALAEAIVADLVATCPTLAEAAKTGRAVYELNFNVHAQTAVWNVDLVIGRPPIPLPPSQGPISKAQPASVEIAMELKSIMTEHRKQVKNRKRDLEASHANAHSYRDAAIAAGVFVVNQSLTFQSPLKSNPTRHGRDRAAVVGLVRHCINEMRNVIERQKPGEVGMDAKCVIVVDMDNVNLPDAKFIERAPAPQVGDLCTTTHSYRGSANNTVPASARTYRQSDPRP